MGSRKEISATGPTATSAHPIYSRELRNAWRIERIKRQLIFAVGGSDKVAVPILAGSAPTMWKNFPAGDIQWVLNVPSIAAAFLGALAIDGMLLSLVFKNLSYQKDLLTIAIAQLEKEAGCS
ncbi:hypothetical protein [Undibacterium sp.]|uniref:hypothetical protein n=1 Tax=Undibacterium sp. TaxID=1914977 RepID=UPI002D1C8669|nr:hypothetical protein [Undibacterium sp.]HTD02746.1 hypothetical protein [Undibacterium sp.]